MATLDRAKLRRQGDDLWHPSVGAGEMVAALRSADAGDHLPNRCPRCGGLPLNDRGTENGTSRGRLMHMILAVFGIAAAIGFTAGFATKWAEKHPRTPSNVVAFRRRA